jgi:hypothetical protein
MAKPLRLVINSPAPLDSLDALKEKAAKLAALMHSMSGAGFETFNLLPAEHRENLLWLASDMAGEVNALVELVGHE